jgi:glycerol-3-phosphate dehydrogenase (NAD(P)+)
MRVSVLESGAWGTALATNLAKKGETVTLHSIYEKRSEELRTLRENKYLPGVKLPDNLEFSDTFEEVAGADVAIFVTPSFALRETAKKLKGIVRDDTVLVSAAKGIEPDTCLRLSQIIEQELGGSERIVALSGPSHAEEVGRGVPTGCVSASKNIVSAELVQDLLMSPRFRIYTSDDIVGVELCGALKNIIALCAGICDGLGLGDNTIALMMTRGLTELAELGEMLGGRKETFTGLAGVVTCTSKHSRNRRAGVYIGKGMSVKEAMEAVGAVVEGYYAAKSAVELADKTGAPMPIIREAYKILYEDKSPESVIAELMSRPKRSEHEIST